MLHHLLTRIDYPSIAGINGVPWDAVELPSQFMENFAWNYDVLSRCSAHHESGEPLPRELFDRLKTAATSVRPWPCCDRSSSRCSISACMPNTTRSDAACTAGAAEVRDEVALIRHPDYNRLPHAFRISLPAAMRPATTATSGPRFWPPMRFGAFEEAGIFDRETAQRFRSEILEVGGSRDIMQAILPFAAASPKSMRCCGKAA